MKIFLIFAVFVVSQATRLPENPRKMTPFYRQQQEFGHRMPSAELPREEEHFYRSTHDNRGRMEPEDNRFYRNTPRVNQYSEPNFSVERDAEAKFQPSPFKMHSNVQPTTYNPFAYMAHAAPKSFGSYQLF
ncbi:uncharacterized protein [Centruroides vittatus]|uniref:uncharacterized protein n=1 Tax=Centruroides vittatus TaxID=120091 RepID=UPI00350FDB5A